MTASSTATVRRYVRDTYEPDDCTYDIIWTDRLTGRTVLSYDGADPANFNPAYGAKTDAEVFADRGLDIYEEIEATKSITPVSSYEIASCAAQKSARLAREAEEADARDLLTFLGAEAAHFDFGSYHHDENAILRPALERRGYTGVSFYMDEQDSFGPLIRGCVATDSSGKRVRFYYG